MTDVREKLNKAAWKAVNNYLALDVFEKKVRTPYYINLAERDWVKAMKDNGVKDDLIKKIVDGQKVSPVFGKFRAKGTPEQIARETELSSRVFGFDFPSVTEEMIRDHMQLAGLGIDCSGFVFNVLFTAFDQVGKKEDFLESLDWLDRNQKTVSRANCDVFAGTASKKIEPNDVSDMDLILFKKVNGNTKYSHMGLVLSSDEGLMITQSSITVFPSGVSVCPIHYKDGRMEFDYLNFAGEDWATKLEKGIIEFRRLKIVSSI